MNGAEAPRTVCEYCIARGMYLDAAGAIGKLENCLAGGMARKGFTQECDVVTKLIEQIAQVAGTS